MLAEQVIRNLKTMSVSALCVTGCLLLAACGGGGGGGATATAALDGAATPAVVSAALPSSGSLVVTASAPMPVATGGTVGGSGATCNPSTAGWPSCARATILISGSVPNKVHISGGHLSSAMTLNTANTEYILDGDITADGTAFSIRADYVYLNLNGHTITYNQTTPGEGVNVTDWNLHDVAVANGSIIQGAALSEGDQYGRGNNPVLTGTIATLRPVDNIQIANLYVSYGGRDVGGIVCAGSNGLYEQNTIEDTYQFGTLKNRHQGFAALTGVKNTASAVNCVYRSNTIINSRHRGIDTGNGSTTYGNYITTRSIATNANGISASNTSSVYNNTVIARGEHSIGIACSGPASQYVPLSFHDVEIYNNYIDSQTTALGEEYSSAYLANPTGIIVGNEGVGFRTTWGGNGIHFYNNYIVVRSYSNYTGTYSPTGEVAHIKTEARGIMAMLLNGETALFENNEIIALDHDGAYVAKGIVVTGYDYKDGGNNAGLVFKGNTVTSNIMNVALGDQYGASTGWPLFLQNTFIKDGNYAAYATIGTGFGGYNIGTGKFVANTYVGGASETSLDMHFGNHNTETNAWKSIIFGRLMTATIKNSSGVVQPGITLETHLQSGDTRSVTYTIPSAGLYLPAGSYTATTKLNSQVPVQGNPGLPENTEVVTDANGQAYVIVYDYELHDVGSTSSVPLTAYYQPHAVELGSLLLTPYVTGSLAWDALTSSGSYTYSYTESGGSWQ